MCKKIIIFKSDLLLIQNTTLAIFIKTDKFYRKNVLIIFSYKLLYLFLQNTYYKDYNKYIEIY